MNLANPQFPDVQLIADADAELNQTPWLQMDTTLRKSEMKYLIFCPFTSYTLSWSITYSSMKCTPVLLINCMEKSKIISQMIADCEVDFGPCCKSSHLSPLPLFSFPPLFNLFHMSSPVYPCCHPSSWSKNIRYVAVFHENQHKHSNL